MPGVGGGAGDDLNPHAEAKPSIGDRNDGGGNNIALYVVGGLGAFALLIVAAVVSRGD